MAVELLFETRQSLVFLRRIMVNSVSRFEFQGIVFPISAWSQIFSASLSDGSMAHLELCHFVFGLLSFK
jgi:hypothetical protein